MTQLIKNSTQDNCWIVANSLVIMAKVLMILTQPSGLNFASEHLIVVSAVQAGVNVLRYYWLLRAIKLRSAYKTYGDNWVQCCWL